MWVCHRAWGWWDTPGRTLDLVAEAAQGLAAIRQVIGSVRGTGCRTHLLHLSFWAWTGQCPG